MEDDTESIAFSLGSSTLGTGVTAEMLARAGVLAASSGRAGGAAGLLARAGGGGGEAGAAAWGRGGGGPVGRVVLGTPGGGALLAHRPVRRRGGRGGAGAI